MRGGGGPHTRGKSTAPSRVERVAKYPIPGAEKPADLAHPPLSLKVVIVNLRRGSVKTRDEFGELVIATTHAMSCIVAEGLRALCCTPPVQFYPPCAHECSRMPPRVRAWPRDSAPGRVHASGFQGRALAKHAGQVWARAAGSAHLQALPG